MIRIETFIIIIVSLLLTRAYANDVAISQLYLEKAVELWRTGEREAVNPFLNISESFSEPGSDVLFMRSQLMEADVSDPAPLLYKALELDNWRHLEQLMGAVELCRLLAHRMTYRVLYQFIETLPPELHFDGEIAYYKALAAVETGRVEEAKKLSRSAILAGKRPLQFYELLFRYGYLKEDITEFNRYIDENPPSDPSPLRMIILCCQDNDIRSRFMNTYRTLYGNDYFSTSYTIIDGEDALYDRLQILVRDFPNRDFALAKKILQRLERIDDDSVGYPISDGEWIVDPNYDGYFEETLLFDDGVLRRRTIAPRGERLLKKELSFNEDGLLERYVIEELTTGKRLSVSYRDYPYWKEVTVVEGGLERIYHPGVNGSLRPVALFQPASALEWTEIELPDSLFSETSLFGDSSALIEKTFSGERVEQRTYRVVNGDILEIREDLNNDGFDEYALKFEDSIPVSGFRDLDHDRRYEIYEYYKDGLLNGITVDKDSDTLWDYAEEKGEVVKKAWRDKDSNFFDLLMIALKGHSPTIDFSFNEKERKFNDIFSWSPEIYPNRD